MGGSRKRTGRLRRWVFALLLLTTLAAAGAAATGAAYLLASVPLPGDLGVAPTRVLDVRGREIGIIAPQSARQDVDLDALPDHVWLAVLAAEDRDFLQHRGVSPVALARALAANLGAGEIVQGGSTITQQYIKNAVTGGDRDLVRKATEAVLAVKMEQRFTKREILDMYLDTIYLGRGAYGIGAAARTWFGVPAADLDLNQAATLAGMISAPERLDPDRDARAADQRRHYVLDGMLAEGWIDPATHVRVGAAGLPPVASPGYADRGPAGYVLQAVRRELGARLGAGQAHRGLVVQTEIDLDLQRAAQAAVTAATSGREFSGALVALAPHTGGVRALVGGPDAARQPFDAALDGRRQPGSAFKPVVMATYVDAGLSPRSRYPAPASVSVPDGRGGMTTIANAGGLNRGSQTVTEALATSTNTVFVQMVDEVGPDAVVEMAHRLGVPDDRRLDPVPSIALGTSSVAPVDLATVYATFASGGTRARARLIRRVAGPVGDILLEDPPDTERVLERSVANAVTGALQGVIDHGTGTAARLDRPAAGKTGTSDDNRDAWFAGYTPQLATAVWFGRLDDAPMDGVSGGGLPAEVWARFMRDAHGDVAVAALPSPRVPPGEVVDRTVGADG